VQRLLGQLAFVRRVQIEELAAGVSHVADHGGFSSGSARASAPAFRQRGSRLEQARSRVARRPRVGVARRFGRPIAPVSSVRLPGRRGQRFFLGDTAACTLGLLTRFGWRHRRVYRFQLCFNGCDVAVDQVFEEAALSGAQLLATLGELVPFEQGDFVAEVFVDCFDAMDLLAHRVDLRHQLRSECTQLVGGHRIKIGRASHAQNFARAGSLWR